MQLGKYRSLEQVNLIDHQDRNDLPGGDLKNDLPDSCDHHRYLVGHIAHTEVHQNLTIELHRGVVTAYDADQLVFACMQCTRHIPQGGRLR